MKGWFNLHGAVERPILEANRSHNFKRGHPGLEIGVPVATFLGIVCGGAGAERAIDHDGPLMAINGAADWLAERGRVAEYHLLMDPLPRLARFVQTPRKGTRYLVSACCDPAVFDALDGQDITILDTRQGGLETADAIPVGPSTMSCAPIVGVYLGYQNSRLIGAPCCYFDGGPTHVWGDSPTERQRFEVRCDGERFVTSSDLVIQAEFMSEFVRDVGLNVEIEPGTFLAAMVRTEGEWEFAIPRTGECELSEAKPFEVI